MTVMTALEYELTTYNLLKYIVFTILSCKNVFFLKRSKNLFYNMITHANTDESNRRFTIKNGLDEGRAVKYPILPILGPAKILLFLCMIQFQNAVAKNRIHIRTWCQKLRKKQADV